MSPLASRRDYIDGLFVLELLTFTQSGSTLILEPYQLELSHTALNITMLVKYLHPYIAMYLRLYLFEKCIHRVGKLKTLQYDKFVISKVAI